GKVDMVERHPGHTELLAQDLRDLRFRDQAGLDQQRSDPARVAFLKQQDFFELWASDDLSVDEKLTQPDPSYCHGRVRAYSNGLDRPPSRQRQVRTRIRLF